jgi:hypothetical protein
MISVNMLNFDMQSVDMLGVDMLNVDMASANMLSVVAPFSEIYGKEFSLANHVCKGMSEFCHLGSIL